MAWLIFFVVGACEFHRKHVSYVNNSVFSVTSKLCLQQMPLQERKTETTIIDARNPATNLHPRKNVDPISEERRGKARVSISYDI